MVHHDRHGLHELANFQRQAIGEDADNVLDGDDAVDTGQSAQRLRVEVDAAARRLELKQDQRQADLRDRLVIANRNLGVQWGAEIGGDGEDEERLGPGRLEVTRLLDSLAGERSS